MPDSSDLSKALTASEVAGILGALFVALAIGFGGGLLADLTHVDDAPVLALLAGGAVILASSFRPSVFWNHLSAIAIRSLLGDRGAVAFYVVLGLASITWGGMQIREWSNNAALCRQMYLEATSPQERLRVLQHVPGKIEVGDYHHVGVRTCERYREFGKF